MNITFQKLLIAALFVPAIALAGVTAEALMGQSETRAQAQQLAPPPPAAPEDPAAAGSLPPCPPGAAPTPNCRPWNPPRRAESEDECECQITYQTINGQRVAVRDCYVLLPNNKVYYCDSGRLVPR